jgi:hypothetical protein
MFSTTADGASIPTERMRINSSGNVGIGTSSPGSKLEVEGNSTDSRVHISNTSSGGTAFDGSGSGLLLTAGAMNSTSKFTPAIQFGSIDGSFTTTNPKVLAAINGVASQSYTTDTAGAMELAFYTTPLNQSTGNDVQERLRIDRDGNVGIGTNNPQHVLDVLSQNSNTDETVAAFGNQTIQGGLEVITNGNLDWGFNAKNSRNLVFETNQTERMRIDSGGIININTGGGNISVNTGTADGLTIYSPTTPGAGVFQTSTNGGPAMYLRRRTNDGSIIVFFRDTTSVGTISVSTTATFYNTSSDYRLKENVVPLANAVDRLNQLQVHRFNFIAEPEVTLDGFLAHEAQTVVPECVTGTKDEVDDDGNAVMQGIDQSKLVPLLTAALQEALAKIEALEQRLTDAGL